MGVRETAEREALGRTIRTVRQAQGTSVRQLATRLEISPSTMSAVERGRAPLDADRLHDVAKALGVSEVALKRGEIRIAVGAREATRKVRVTSTDSDADEWQVFEELAVDPVMAAAICAFVEVGYHGVGIRVIAERAGVSVPALYHYYPSKQAILCAILDLTMNDLNRRLDLALVDARVNGLRPHERLYVVVYAHALFHASRRDLAFIGASEMRSLEAGPRRRIARSRSRFQERLDAEISICTTRGLATVDDVGQAGRAISTMCTSICQWFDPRGPLTPEAVARDYAKYALRLIGVSDQDFLLGSDLSYLG